MDLLSLPLRILSLMVIQQTVNYLPPSKIYIINFFNEYVYCVQGVRGDCGGVAGDPYAVSLGGGGVAGGPYAVSRGGGVAGCPYLLRARA